MLKEKKVFWIGRIENKEIKLVGEEIERVDIDKEIESIEVDEEIVKEIEMK